MPRSGKQNAQRFGGKWTEQKLAILGAYLTAYTTALKNQPFDLLYLDAFAGSGSVQIERENEESAFLLGSPLIAASVEDKAFDRLVLIERSEANAAALRGAISGMPNPDRASVIVGDANIHVLDFCDRMGEFDRAVVFLDPFALEVTWDTVAAIAETQKCDTWILFPISAIRRMLPLHDEPTVENIAHLTRVFGDASWRSVYDQPTQPSLLGTPESDSGIEQIARIYAERLRSVFVRVVGRGGVLLNSRRSPLFVFVCAVANERGATAANRIATHIIDSMCDRTIDLTNPST